MTGTNGGGGGGGYNDHGIPDRSLGRSSPSVRRRDMLLSSSGGDGDGDGARWSFYGYGSSSSLMRSGSMRRQESFRRATSIARETPRRTSSRSDGGSVGVGSGSSIRDDRGRRPGLIRQASFQRRYSSSRSVSVYSVRTRSSAAAASDIDDHDEDEEDDDNKKDSGGGIHTFLACCMTANYISVGYLFVPWAFATSGILLAAVIFLSVMLQSFITCSYVAESCARAELLANHSDDLLSDPNDRRRRRHDRRRAQERDEREARGRESEGDPWDLLVSKAERRETTTTTAAATTISIEISDRVVKDLDDGGEGDMELDDDAPERGEEAQNQEEEEDEEEEEEDDDDTSTNHTNNERRPRKGRHHDDDDDIDDDDETSSSFTNDKKKKKKKKIAERNEDGIVENNNNNNKKNTHDDDPDKDFRHDDDHDDDDHHDEEVYPWYYQGLYKGRGGHDQDEADPDRNRTAAADAAADDGLALIRHRKYELPELSRIFLGDAWRVLFTLTSGCDLYGLTWSIAAVFASSLAEEFPIRNYARDDGDDYVLYVFIFGLIVVSLSFVPIMDQLYVQLVFFVMRMTMVLVMIVTVSAAYHDSPRPHFGFLEGPRGDATATTATTTTTTSTTTTLANFRAAYL